ncbi:MAG: serine O-acetyltransferase EpsC [Planctomycetota bacterium]
MPADTTSPQTPPDFAPLIQRLTEQSAAHPDLHHVGATFLPSRNRVIEFIEVMRRLVFPGFFDPDRLTPDTLADHTRDLLTQADALLYEQTREALRYKLNLDGSGKGDDCEACDIQARDLTNCFFNQLPELRRLLLTDVHAAFDGDPAAQSYDEVIFCYPGLDAIFTHRMAHCLYTHGVPLLPRMMSELIHNDTGIEIHPGATLGESFFIDHGTGVVIGETVVIGDRVKVYQSVTLGALSTKGGQDWRGTKRHPTIEDDVTIYGGAVILGGETVIGKGATIGGNIFVTRSIPPGHTVTAEMPNLILRPPKAPKGELPTDFDPSI